MKKQSEYWKKNKSKIIKKQLEQEGKFEKDWVDIKGNGYDYKYQAQLSTFFIMIWARFRDGFPIVIPKFWYNAITIYPFIFIRKDSVITPRLNHEMIHIHQQREMLVVFAYMWYSIEFFIRLFMYRNIAKAYERHSMEREARENEMNVQYLLVVRKPYAFLKYLK